MTAQKKFYITTAISYANGAPHIGHAYEALATDALARFKRLDGFDVMFLTGTDEHGQKIEQTAAQQEEGCRFRRRNRAAFRSMVAALDCSNDDFIRTTEPRHKETAPSCGNGWRRRAISISAKYSGWYSVRDEAYYTPPIVDRGTRRQARTRHNWHAGGMG